MALECMVIPLFCSSSLSKATRGWQTIEVGELSVRKASVGASVSGGAVSSRLLPLPAEASTVWELRAEVATIHMYLRSNSRAVQVAELAGQLGRDDAVGAHQSVR